MVQDEIVNHFTHVDLKLGVNLRHLNTVNHKGNQVSRDPYLVVGMRVRAYLVSVEDQRIIYHHVPISHRDVVSVVVDVSRLKMVR